MKKLGMSIIIFAFSLILSGCSFSYDWIIKVPDFGGENEATDEIKIYEEQKVTETTRVSEVAKTTVTTKLTETSKVSKQSEIPDCLKTELEKDWEYTTFDTNYKTKYDSEYWNLLDTADSKMFYEATITTDFSSSERKNIFLFYDSNSKKYSVNSLRKAIQYARYDHPEIEMLNIDYNYNMKFYEPSKGFVGISYHIGNPSYSEYNSQLNEVNYEIESLVREVSQTEDEIEKHRLIFNWITSNVTYRETGLEVNNFSFENGEFIINRMRTYHTQNIYGPIVKKEGICEGIADAYKYICNQCDLECMIVNGSVEVNSKTEYHTWNIVKVDNKWYLVDATWDLGTRYPQYFMVDDLYKGNRKPFNIGKPLPGYGK